MKIYHFESQLKSKFRKHSQKVPTFTLLDNTLLEVIVYQIKISVQGVYGKSPYELLLREVLEVPLQMQGISLGPGCPPRLDDKTLLLKTTMYLGCKI